MLKRLPFFLVTAMAVTAIGSFNTRPAGAQSVMVFPENAENMTQSIFIKEVKSRLSREQFMVIDDAELGALFREEGLPLTQENILTRKNMITSRYGTPFLVFVSATRPRFEGATAFLSVNAEIFATASGNYVANWSIPERMVNFSQNCDTACRDATIATESGYLGMELAEAIGSLLTQGSSGIAPSGDMIRAIEVEMLDLAEDKRTVLIDLMLNEFPGYLKISNMRSSGPRHKFKYMTTASPADMRSWLVLALTDIGYTVDDDISLMVSDQRIDIRARRLVNPRGRLN